MDSCRRNCVSPITSCVRSLALTTFFSLVIPVFPVTFVFDGFNGSNLILEADASLIRSRSVLTLTNHTRFMLGRALYSFPVQMKSNGMLSSFSTTFVFSMVPPPSNAGGNGMAFIITPYTSPMGAVSAQYLGLLNNTSNGQPYNHLFAVEFDTIRNVEFSDPDGNHVGVDINNLISVNPEPAGYWKGEDFQELSLKSGRNIQAWIDYDHLQSRLNVSIMLVGLPRPQKPLISAKIDLHSVLKEKMFVGFSAATGGNFFGDHYVLAWSFSTEGRAPDLNISRLPSFAVMNYKRPRGGFIAGVTVAALVLFSLAVVAVFFRRAKYRGKIEEWEREFWPHRFAYKDLRTATRGFRDQNVLGQGGFGKVYRGVLQGSGQEVAVKCLTEEFTEGMRGFVAEISTVGRMQHRNLVQLRGWCRRQKQLFIVYDYMPNGSLDKLILGNPTTVLPLLEEVVSDEDLSLPPVRVSEDTSRFSYTNPTGHPSGVRIARIIQESFKLGLPDVKWFVLADDDTVFNVENLIAVLSKYDSSEMYYIGSASESHSANTYFSHSMAYGGGGIAISYPLAEELSKMQDECLERYSHLFGSDDRLHACISELGVPLTREPGFHQWDVRGNAHGLLAAHPIAPFVSFHHVEAVNPIFPQHNSLDGLKLLMKAMRTDPSGFLQQSICYDRRRWLTFSISMGYVVQVFPQIMLPRELERSERTFTAWNKLDTSYEFDFDTRPPQRLSCKKPFLFFLEDIQKAGNTTVSTYKRDIRRDNLKRASFCFSWALPPGEVQNIQVVSRPMNERWHLVPRRQCCEVIETKNKVLGLMVGPCEQGSISSGSVTL